MKSGYVYVLMVAIFGCQTASHSPNDVPPEEIAQIREELIRRAERDQYYRSFDYPSVAETMARRMMAEAADVDSSNLVFLRTTVERIGWPDSQRFGQEAAHAAFLLAQHADSDPDFQEQVLPLMAAAVRRGEGSARDLAYLVDRVRVKQHRPQVYGTQYDLLRDSRGSVIFENGRPKYVIPIVIDPKRIDERRASVGLGPWSDYEKRMAASQGRPRVAEPMPDTTRG